MKIEDIERLALKVAAASTCKKRKVGAVITDRHNTVLSTGANHNDGHDCECEDGHTLDSVIHAEVAAISNLDGNGLALPEKIYVTHTPCVNCADAINKIGIKEVVIVEDFMKFDAGKLRYGLIPPSATKALASVLTYGAKKYKPNNWKQADDTDRYVDALYRHLESWRSGEKVDKESGLSHLSHALTNIAFLIHFED